MVIVQNKKINKINICITTWFLLFFKLVSAQISQLTNNMKSSYSWQTNRSSIVKNLPALFELQLYRLCLNKLPLVPYAYNNIFTIISLCMARSPKRTLSSRFPDEIPVHNSPFYCMNGCTAIDFTAIEMWRIYLNENSLVEYPSGCNGLVELLLHKQIYRWQSEWLQIWIQTNPAASDNFRQHSLWQVTFITCTVITGQHGERELHGCCRSVHRT